MRARVAARFSGSPADASSACQRHAAIASASSRTATANAKSTGSPLLSRSPIAPQSSWGTDDAEEQRGRPGPNPQRADRPADALSHRARSSFADIWGVRLLQEVGRSEARHERSQRRRGAAASRSSRARRGNVAPRRCGRDGSSASRRGAARRTARRCRGRRGARSSRAARRARAWAAVVSSTQPARSGGRCRPGTAPSAGRLRRQDRSSSTSPLAQRKGARGAFGQPCSGLWAGSTLDE